MRKSLVGIIYILIIISLCIISILIYFYKDRKPPKIEKESNIELYNLENGTNALLEGIVAIDKRDGDVSDSLRIRNVYYTSENVGIVVYVAKDKSNNISETTMSFQYTGLPIEDNNGDDELDINNIETNEESKVSTELETTTESTITTESITNNDKENGIDYEKLKKDRISQGKPFVKLSVHEVTLSLGSSFVVQSYVEEAINTTDTAYSLLQIDGDTVDTWTVGTYVIQIYTLDENGNESNKEELKVIVK